MAYVQLIEEPGGVRGFRAGDNGTLHMFGTDVDGEMTSAFRKAVAEALVDGKIGELEGTERDMARMMSEQIGIRKDADTGGIMVCWYPPAELAAKLAGLLNVHGSEPAEALHITLLYLGNAATSGPWDITAVAAVTKLFAMQCYPVEGNISGIGHFVGPDDSDAIIALVDCKALADMRRCLLEELSWRGSLPHNCEIYSPDGHGFVPHITLAYVPKGTQVSVSLPEVIPFKIESLSLSAGADRGDFSFEGDRGDCCEPGFAPYYASKRASWVAEPPEQKGPGSTRLAEAEEAGALGVAEGEDALAYSIEKAVDESRYTLGPLYVPERKDAHGEGTDAETLQKAVWEYVRESAANGRKINLQHGDFGDVSVGEWVEVMAWPYEHTITLTKADGEKRDVEMPAGTVYVGVQWDEAAWPLVKNGKLGGYSLGGKAVRVAGDEDWASMDGTKKASDEAMKPHAYEDDGDGKCTMCGKGAGAGSHTKTPKED